VTCMECGALGGIRTPDLLIRSQMLYPLSYERWCGGQSTTRHARFVQSRCSKLQLLPGLNTICV
jgi:hypothetical protein